MNSSLKIERENTECYDGKSKINGNSMCEINLI